jgi:hypothetical protein
MNRPQLTGNYSGLKSGNSLKNLCYDSLATLNNGMINYFNFDETSGKLLDQIDGNHGTVTGATQGVTGVIRTAYSFDGNNDYIDLTKTHTFQLTDSFTISLLFKPTAINTGYQMIDRTTNINSIIQIFLTFKDLSFRIRGSNGAGVTTVNYINACTVANVWYHTICERNVITDQINIRVNDIDWITPLTDATTAAIGPFTFRIGVAQNLTTDFNGSMDELRIWKRLLTSEEKTNLYNYYR